jgi:hypothetical protein
MNRALYCANEVDAMLIKVTNDAALLVLAALRRVATAGGSRCLTAADRRALDAFDRFVMWRDPASDLDDILEASPTQLAATLQSDDVRTHVVQFLVVMAFVDGVIDEVKIPIVIDYAKALEVQEDAVRQLAELGRGNLAWVRADVQRQNLLSIIAQELNGRSTIGFCPKNARSGVSSTSSRSRDLTTPNPLQQAFREITHPVAA